MVPFDLFCTPLILTTNPHLSLSTALHCSQFLSVDRHFTLFISIGLRWSPSLSTAIRSLPWSLWSSIISNTVCKFQWDGYNAPCIETRKISDFQYIGRVLHYFIFPFGNIEFFLSVQQPVSILPLHVNQVRLHSIYQLIYFINYINIVNFCIF